MFLVAGQSEAGDEESIKQVFSLCRLGTVSDRL